MFLAALKIQYLFLVVTVKIIYLSLIFGVLTTKKILEKEKSSVRKKYKTSKIHAFMTKRINPYD